MSGRRGARGIEEEHVAQRTQEGRAAAANRRFLDEKIKPLLDPDQYQKFQTMREDARRKMIARTMASEALRKAEADLSNAQWFTGKSEK